VGYRDVDPDYLLLSNQSLASIMAQTYTNWTLIIVGDNISPENVAKVKAVIARHQIPNEVLFHNLEESQTSAAIHARLNETERVSGYVCNGIVLCYSNNE
jgi:hypothetical protein